MGEAEEWDAGQPREVILLERGSEYHPVGCDGNCGAGFDLGRISICEIL